LFLDAIIRVANLRYGPPPESIAGLDASSSADGEAAEAAAAAAAAPPPIDSLAGRVSYAVERDILVGACRTVVDEFRASVASEAVRAVFRANKGKLSALFRRYASMEDGGSASNTDGARSGSDSAVKKQGAKLGGPGSHPDSHLSLSFAQFLSLLRDLGLVEGSSAATMMMAPPSWSRRASTGLAAATVNASGTPATATTKLSEARLRTLFQNVQQEEEFAGSDDAGASHRTTAAAAPAVTGTSAPVSSASSASSSSPLLRSINYVEWLESLASLSCWVLPDPFVPLAAKLDAFLSDTVFGALRRH
jgi:hypothetical protein